MKTAGAWLLSLVGLSGAVAAEEQPLICFGNEPSWSVDLLPARDPLARLAGRWPRPRGLAAGLDVHRQHVRHAASGVGASIYARRAVPFGLLPGPRASRWRRYASFD